MNKLLVPFLLLSTLIVSGCEVESEKSAYLCDNAENKYIDGSTGMRDVFRINLGYGIDIGYSHQGVLVPHSECAPARVTFDGTSTVFEYFEFGQPKEESGILNIRFSSLSYGKQAFAVEREDRQGRAAFEWGERDYDYGSTGRVTKKLWLSEFPFESISSEKDFENSGVTQATAELGEATKTVRYNANTTQYDCVYSDNTGNTLNSSCDNEAALDIEYFGTQIDLVPYIDSLSKKPGYETEPRELCADVNRYQPDDGTCEQ